MDLIAPIFKHYWKFEEKNFIDHVQITLIIQKKNELRIKLRRERKRKNIQTETKKDLIQSAKEKGVLSPG